jgi:transketolase
MSRLKQEIVLASMAPGEGHIASAFSVLDILWVLYDRVLRYDARDPDWTGRDRLVLSKGHASLALYAVLAEKGFFPAAELKSFATRGSRLGGHPDCTKVPGVEASTGSLGHGLPISVGIALALRMRSIDRRVYVIVGDGECNEGSIWESALLAAHHHLSNLTCIVDYNHSTDRALLMGDMTAKFDAFGWAPTAVDGHKHDEIYSALAHPDPTRPSVVVARTIKGFGCRDMENNPAWHHRAPTVQELPMILEELACASSL